MRDTGPLLFDEGCQICLPPDAEACKRGKDSVLANHVLISVRPRKTGFAGIPSGRTISNILRLIFDALYRIFLPHWPNASPGRYKPEKFEVGTVLTRLFQV
jgi:hypothetical protein